MKNKFPGYYKPSDEEFAQLWETGLFVFDTSALLDIYRYTPKTVDVLLKTMEAIRERLWIPYHVAKEYHKNFCETISKQADKYQVTMQLIDKLNEEFDAKRNHPFLSDKLAKETRQLFEKIKKELKQEEEKLLNLLNDNPKKERLAEILKEKIGDGFDEKKLLEIYSEGEIRYSNETPPGYKDIKKPIPERYGDLIIWKEILEKSTSIDGGIIFITSDKKEDWFHEVKGRVIGPRPELIAEYLSGKNTSFYCYQTGNFLEFSKKYLKTSITKNAIEEIKEYENQIEKSFKNMLISDSYYNSYYDNYLKDTGITGGLLDYIRRTPSPWANVDEKFLKASSLNTKEDSSSDIPPKDSEKTSDSSAEG